MVQEKWFGVAHDNHWFRTSLLINFLVFMVTGAWIKYNNYAEYKIRTHGIHITFLIIKWFGKCGSEFLNIVVYSGTSQLINFSAFLIISACKKILNHGNHKIRQATISLSFFTL
jgi:hypothetical protein